MSEPTYIHIDNPDVKVDGDGNPVTKLKLIDIAGRLVSQSLDTELYYYHTADDVGVIVGPYDTLKEAMGESLRYKGDCK